MKLYPFSVSRIHDIEFRRNKIKNTLSDLEAGDISLDAITSAHLEAERDALSEILTSHTDGRVYWLSGRLYGIAKEASAWAISARADSMRRTRA